MKKIILLCLYAMTFPATTFAQSTIPRQGYFHFSGTLGDKIQATLDLIKINDSLYGDLTYSFFSENQAEHNMFFGQSKQLSGKMLSVDHFYLKEVLSEEGNVLSGKFLNSNTISGSWETVKKEKIPFKFYEKYAVGSVQFNLYHESSVRNLVKKPKSPQASIDLLLLLPGESSNTILSDTLRAMMLQSYFSHSSKSAPEEMIKEMKEVFFNNYTESNEQIFKEHPDGGNFNWELSKFIHITNNDQYLLTYYILTYAFTGGAHGLETHDYYSIDLKKGKKIQLNDIIMPGTESKLISLLTRKLKEIIGLSSDQKLTEFGYFSDEVKPNENFYVTKNGIGFFYNHYELAPYSFGLTDIFLSYTELKGIVP